MRRQADVYAGISLFNQKSSLYRQMLQHIAEDRDGTSH